MSGPVDIKDLADSGQARPASAPTTEIIGSRLAQVGSLQVRRALPTRGRRSVGPWCFADHFGPAEVNERLRPDIGPHPHMGLQTITWLLSGELIHRDSLGTEQTVRPGELNIMTAGHGVAHAEEAPAGYRGMIHGVQLWVAMPPETRDGPAEFEHHPELPQQELACGTATVLAGALHNAVSPARRDTDHVGADLALDGGRTVLTLEPRYEYALLVTSGMITAESQSLAPGRLLYLGAGRSELRLGSSEPSRALLLGGVPFPEPLHMWWNFVARSRDEIDAAYRDWASDSGRFGTVASSLPRVETGPPPWHPADS